MRRLLFLIVIAGLARTADAAPAIPDFTGLWQHTPVAEYEGRPSRPHPVWDLKHPLSPTDFSLIWEGNGDNPILQPWAATEVRRHTEGVHVGHPIPTPQELCEPSGVPNVITLPSAVEFLQLPNEIVILYQRDHQVRRIKMNAAHAAHPAASWYGDAIGRYEGDTLVIDTIGMNDKTPVDIFGTPHTTALHTVERYRLINGGKQLEVIFTLDDPKAYTTLWSGRMVYGPANGGPILTEDICAENDINVVTQQLYPIPTETKSIF